MSMTLKVMRSPPLKRILKNDLLAASHDIRKPDNRL